MGGFLFVLVGILAGLLFAPLPFQVNVYFDVFSGKIGCNLRLFRMMKLLGGYLTPCPGGFAWHISKKKALLFTYLQMNEGRKSINEKDGFRIVKAQTVFEIGAEYILFTITVQNALKGVALFSSSLQEFESKIVLKNSDNFRAFIRITLHVRLWKQLFKLIKNAIIGGVEKWRKTKSVA